jgi:hypothetical protein
VVCFELVTTHSTRKPEPGRNALRLAADAWVAAETSIPRNWIFWRFELSASICFLRVTKRSNSLVWRLNLSRIVENRRSPMEIGERKLRATAARAPQTVGTNSLLYKRRLRPARHGERAWPRRSSPPRADRRSPALTPSSGAQTPPLAGRHSNTIIIYRGSTFISYIYDNVKGWCVWTYLHRLGNGIAGDLRGTDYGSKVKTRTLHTPKSSAPPRVSIVL